MHLASIVNEKRPHEHPGGHGLHAHFAVGRFVPRSLIERSWGRGFVHVKLLGDLPVGSGTLAEASCLAVWGADVTNDPLS